MAANCAGIIGGQLFRSDDLPYYHRGWSIIAMLMSISLSAVITLLTVYWRAKATLAKSEDVFEQPAVNNLDTTSRLGGYSVRQRLPYNY